MSLYDRNTVQVLAVLDGIQPFVWRRLLVPWRTRLCDLHQVMQCAFGWCDMHIYDFHIGGLMFGPYGPNGPSHEDDRQLLDDRSVRVCDFDRQSGVSFGYRYDDWHHTITLERFIVQDPSLPHPICIGGERARPPEDVGGIERYVAFREAVTNPSDPDHRQAKRYAGGSFDPELFDRDLINEDLRAPHRRAARRGSDRRKMSGQMRLPLQNRREPTSPADDRNGSD